MQTSLSVTDTPSQRNDMAVRRKKKVTKKKGAPAELIISKARTKAAVSCKVSSELYGALDAAVREMLAKAEERAAANKRSTLRPQDL